MIALIILHARAMISQRVINIVTRGRGLVEITRRVNEAVMDSELTSGLCNVFLQHTSASLVLTENADPDVLIDLETVLSGLAPDGDPRYVHDAEGPDDMAAHLRAVLTSNALQIPVGAGRLMLGTWQGLYLWEHRHAPHTRHVVITVIGER